MNVGIVFEYPSLNGGEKSMLAVLHYLLQTESLSNRFRFLGICPEDGRLAEELAKVIPLQSWNPRIVGGQGAEGQRRPIAELAQELGQIAARHSLNLLHANSLSMARITGAMKRTGLLDGHLKITGHVRDIMKMPAAAIADLNGNDRLVAVSSAARQALIDQGIDADRCSVIYNGIPINREHSSDVMSTKSRRESFGIPQDAFLLLNVGQICLRKGQLDLAHAVIRLLPEFPNVHVVHLGERYSAKSESVAYANQFRDVFANAGYSDHLHLAGYSSEVPDWMKTADLLVHTARQEPFGRVLLEAAAFGLPILATNVGGTSEMLRDEIEAALIPPSDIQAIQQTICRLIANPRLRQTLATNAKRRILDRFSISQSATQLMDLWSRV